MVTRKARWVNIILALVILPFFSLGCAGISKDTKVKCPKCGAIFSVSEGLKGGGGGP